MAKIPSIGKMAPTIKNPSASGRLAGTSVPGSGARLRSIEAMGGQKVAGDPPVAIGDGNMVMPTKHPSSTTTRTVKPTTLLGQGE